MRWKVCGRISKLQPNEASTKAEEETILGLFYVAWQRQDTLNQSDGNGFLRFVISHANAYVEQPIGRNAKKLKNKRNTWICFSESKWKCKVNFVNFTIFSFNFLDCWRMNSTMPLEIGESAIFTVYTLLGFNNKKIDILLNHMVAKQTLNFTRQMERNLIHSVQQLSRWGWALSMNADELGQIEYNTPKLELNFHIRE